MQIFKCILTYIHISLYAYIRINSFMRSVLWNIDYKTLYSFFIQSCYIINLRAKGLKWSNYWNKGLYLHISKFKFFWKNIENENKICFDMYQIKYTDSNVEFLFLFSIKFSNVDQDWIIGSLKKLIFTVPPPLLWDLTVRWRPQKPTFLNT
jgi:hypothetical protein